MTQIELSVFSTVLGCPQRLCALLPPADRVPAGGCAVLYLLHGFSDGCDSFLRYTALERYCADLPLCVVMPDAGKSFYTDMRYGDAYWTYISREVPQLAAAYLPISTSPAKTYVAGISMGGYGAAKLMLRQPNAYAHAYLLSPVTDIVSVMKNGFDASLDPDAFTKEQLHLDTVFDPAALPGSENDLLSLLEAAQGPLPPVDLYSGTEDFLRSDILMFYEKLKRKGVQASFHEAAGTHGWALWEPQLAQLATDLGWEIL